MPIVHRSGPRSLPSNNRASDVANRALQELAPHQQRKYEAAFLVNPIEVVLYTRLHGGIQCACTFNEVLSSSDNAPSGQILGADGKATQETLQSILTGQRFGFADYGSNYGIKADLPQRSSTDRVTIEDSNGVTADTQAHMSGLDEELPPDFIPNDNVSDQLNRSIRSSDNRSCPVCFGSGYVGGYDIHKGCRIVLDMRNSTLNTYNAEIDAIKVPNIAEITSSGYIEFTLSLPKHVVSIDAFRAMRGKFVSENVSLQAHKAGSTTMRPLASIADIKSICDGTEWILRVSPLSALTGTFVTHVEIQLNLSDKPLVCEFPRLGENSDTNLLEKLSDVQINFPSSVVSLHSEDMIADSFVGKLWQVSASQVMQDHTRNIIGWDCNASILQPFAIQNVLPVRINKLNNRQKNLTPIRIQR